MTVKYCLPTNVNSAYNSSWASNNGGNKWDDVDDPVGSPDDATTEIILTGKSGQCYQSFIHDVPAVPDDVTSIDKVSVFSRWKCTTGTAYNTTVYIQHKTTDTPHQTAVSSITSSYSSKTTDWLTNPATGAAWTVSEIKAQAGDNDLYSYGVKAYANSRVYCVTQCYLSVTYTGGTEPSSSTFILGVMGHKSNLFGGGLT